MRYFARLVSILLLCAAFFTAAGCTAVPQKNTAVGFYMDTVITLTGYCDEELLREAIGLCAEYEKLLSRTLQGSDIWNVNHAKGEAVSVSDDTIRVLELALEVCGKSGGALDITIAPAVDLWDFKSGEAVIPAEDDIAAAMERVDYTKVILDGNTVRIPEGMQIDLGAVAKGYIADKVARFLSDKGVESAALNFGGNVIAMGGKPDGSGWNIGIQDPAAPTGDSAAVLSVQDLSVVTSGVYQRGFDLDGVRYHHILDSETGYPVQNGVASVTIISSESALGDALSTACFAMGREGLDFARSMGAEAVMIYSDGTMECTDGAKKLLIH